MNTLLSPRSGRKNSNEGANLMKYGYFPGCALGSFAKDYDLSLTYVMKALGVDFVEVKDWVCCGASSANATSRLLSIALPVFNLSHAEKDGLEKLIAPCPACVSRFKNANFELEQDAGLKNDM